MRFECQPGCSHCCEVRGFVYLSEKDLSIAAHYLSLTAEEFEARYVIRYPTLLRLRKPLKAQCHFLENHRCTIHPAKPTQCRTYPFWPELVESPSAWGREAKSCPGIGKGNLVQIGEALEISEEMKRAYPSMY